MATIRVTMVTRSRETSPDCTCMYYNLSLPELVSIYNAWSNPLNVIRGMNNDSCMSLGKCGEDPLHIADDGRSSSPCYYCSPAYYRTNNKNRYKCGISAKRGGVTVTEASSQRILTCQYLMFHSNVSVLMFYACFF